ncbi:MAG: hypothetical protein V7642_7121 [Burkholderiales bacterium]
MGTLKVAVHQPNYLPWLGFFHKIQGVDIFVLLDTVQFERRGYTHRVRIADQDGHLLWLTQHICKRPMEEYWIKDVKFSDAYWIEKHLKTFNAVYRRAPYFEETFDLIDSAFRSDISRLSVFNGGLIRILCTALKIPTEIIYASEIDMPPVLSPSERIARITERLGGTHYVSGAGAKAYNDQAVFEKYGVELTYNRFVASTYPQRHSEFCGGLSIVDACFNLGFNGVASLLRTSDKGAVHIGGCHADSLVPHVNAIAP